MTTTAEMTPEKLARLKDRIAKFLAKAEATNFPAEAEAFTEHAQRLMVRYGIAKAEIDAELGRLGQTREPIVQRERSYRGEYARVRMAGLAQVLHAYRLVTVLESKYAGNGSLFVVGAESDVEQMTQLMDSLIVQQEHALATWWAGDDTGKEWMTATERKRERRTFALNFYRGAAVKLRRVVGDEVAGDGKELVLVDRRKRADEWVGEQFPAIKNARATKLAEGSARAKAAGVIAGLSADVNGRKLDGLATAALGAAE